MKKRSGYCPCGLWRERLQRDHIVPTYRARKLGWTKEQMNAPGNIQFLCANCHQDKTLLEQSMASREHIEASPEQHRQRVQKNVVAAHAACKGKPSWNKGIPASDETRKRMSASHKGQVPSNKGVVGVSEATRKKMSDAQRARWLRRIA